MNWIDVFLIGLVLVGVLLGWKGGFLRGAFSLITWFGSFFLAFVFFAPLGVWLGNSIGLSEIWARPFAFLLILFAVIFVVGSLRNMTLQRIPEKVHQKFGNRVLGIIPGLFHGIILAIIISLLLLALPFPLAVSESAHESRIVNHLSVQTERVQMAFDRVFGEATPRTLTTITVPPDSSERISLPFTVSDPEVRIDLEAEMLTLVNTERMAVGLNPLEADPSLAEVARRHSADMFARGYFSHYTPEGLSPFDRIWEAGIFFLAAGENIALAPTLSIAHENLMNSPGHRANILRPQFGRVGIGVLDGGSRGLMITQLFRD